MNVNDEKRDSIMRKIEGLLFIAKDNANDQECQTAFLQAQKLMMKYKISESELNTKSNEQTLSYSDVENLQVSPFKSRLYDWELRLLFIFKDNFPIEYYIKSKKNSHDGKIKRCLMIVGLKEDVQLVRELFVLAIDTVLYFAKLHVKKRYEEMEIKRTKKQTLFWKESYILGFVEGLKKQFEEQVDMLREENPSSYSLAIITPLVVENYIQEKLQLGSWTRQKKNAKVSSQSFLEGKAKGEMTNLQQKRIAGDF